MALDPVLFSDYDQLRRFFYLFAFRDPLGFADAVVAADGMALLDRLWHDWSPGYDAAAQLALVKKSLSGPGRLAAALGYYRAAGSQPAPGGGPYAGEQAAAGRVPPQPTLYLHGAGDGCIGAELARRAEPLLSLGSHLVVVEQAGHFAHLEQPAVVSRLILEWVG